MTMNRNAVVDLIQQARTASALSAFLTPWGIRECRHASITSIADTFGDIAARFWAAVRAGQIRMKPAK